MGKKSKRIRGKSEAGPAREAPALRVTEEETKDNLRFQDPYVEEIVDDGVEEWEDADDEAVEEEAGDYEAVQSWNPLTGDVVEGQELEMDPSAYKMYHALSAEWPSLSFDFLRDDLGEHRTRFPHCLTAVAGSQADQPENNQLTVMKLSDLARMQVETENDVLGDEYDPDGADSDSDDESDEEIDLDPVMEHFSVKHHGGVNRVRCMPQKSHVVATWSDVGKVNLFDMRSILQRFDASSGKMTEQAPMPTKPFVSHSKHRIEGYGMDWSRVKEGLFASGDCHGNIHLWSPQANGSSYSITPAYEPNEKLRAAGAPMCSVEDLQWSPTEATVLASAECGGFVRVFDTRAPGRSMLNHKIHTNGADVNVLSWNLLVSNLLATGSEDGVLSVWDLRKFAAPGDPTPLARFTPHRSAISSVEWHPTDESMVAVTDSTGAYIYDLSVEEDESAATPGKLDIPPQLLFVHSGSSQFKEIHWHPQISSCLMTTAYSGYSIFIPSNL